MSQRNLAIRLAKQILDRDGIRPLMGQAFNQSEYEIIAAAERELCEPNPLLELLETFQEWTEVLLAALEDADDTANPEANRDRQANAVFELEAACNEATQLLPRWMRHAYDAGCDTPCDECKSPCAEYDSAAAPV